jgi:uncharacterized protein
MNELAACPDSRASAVSHFPAHLIAGVAGTSFKHEHLPAILADGKQDGFFEIHSFHARRFGSRIPEGS